MQTSASQEATKLLNKLGIQEPAVDVEKIARYLELELVYEDLEDDVSGFLILKNGKKIIVINKNHHSNRKRFTIAHEIGHFVLHANSNERDIFIDKKFHRDQRSSTGEELEERQANSFAAELLMPEKILQNEFTNNKDIFDGVSTALLAKRFGVSEEALGFRLGRLGIGLDLSDD